MMSFLFKDPSSPSSSVPNHSSSSSLRQFSLAEITEATKNFDESLLIRKGWWIDVYKGSYYDSNGSQKTAAIKSFNIPSSWKDSEKLLTWFHRRLVDVWPQFGHKHVVSVIGYCQEAGKYILVYEYMSNGSLANHLRTKVTPTSFSLSSEKCIEICIDAARGLEYLHNHVIFSLGAPYVHCDVSASNILLDRNGVAKISDLYLEIFYGNQEIASKYAPEYSFRNDFDQSSDVYAFGILLVKVLCRKVSFDKETGNLGLWLKRQIMNESINHTVHPETRAQISPDCLKSLLHIAGKCLNTESLKRPNFTQVVKNLELSISSPFSQQRCCHRFPLQEIVNVTNNFESILGQGGEGKVYKGVLEMNNSTVAVKRLKPDYSSSQFQKEIQMLSNLNHPNLVSLVGSCQESDEHILIYEFMCNGNLSQNLYGRGADSFSWKQRLNICIGAARGLRYLHTGTNTSHKGIIHRDVKPANILLDENFNAKISDFGLSKMGTQDQEISEITTMIKGTTGYYAPEYQKYSKVTRRIDVYAFGVVLTEVLCRKKPWDREESFYPIENEQYGEWAKKNIDPDVKDMIAPACLEEFTGILERCLNRDPKRRPTMNDVVSVLEYAHEWQEAWQRLKEGGQAYLPGRQDRVVFFYTSSSQEFARIFKLRLPLRKFSMHLEERDLRKDLYAKEFKYIFGDTVDMHIPQLFVGGKYVGDVNEMEKLYETGKLAKLLGAVSPTFICDICGERRDCGVCKRTGWFVYCMNCDALTKVWKPWEGKLSSCLECDGNHLICSANTETRPSQIQSFFF